MKPVKGSASININMATSKEEVELLFSKYDNLNDSGVYGWD